MSEKIAKLIDQAGLTLVPRRPYYDDSDSPYRESDNDYFLNNLEATRAFFDGGVEKFAKLVIEECMSVADLPNNLSGQWDHLLPSEVIAKHFGIEK